MLPIRSCATPNLRTSISSSLLVAALVAVSLLSGCSSEDDVAAISTPPDQDAASDITAPDANDDGQTKADAPAKPLVILAVDGNHDGVVTVDDDEDDHGTGIFLANLDDDDGDAERDFLDDKVNGAKDWLDLAPLIVATSSLPDDCHATLTVDDASKDHVRIFRRTDGNSAKALELPVIELSFDDLAQEITFGVEARYPRTSTAKGSWDGLSHWTLTVFQADGTMVDSSEATLRVAPLVFPSNLNPALRVWSSDLDSWFVTDMKAALKQSSVTYAPLHILDDDGYIDVDVWTQDMFELGTMSMPLKKAPDGRHVIQVALRTPTPDRTTADRVLSKLTGEDFGWLHVSNKHYNYDTPSVDSMGNWDTIPAHTTSKGDYPLGRFIIGSTPSRHPDSSAVQFVEAQGIQPLIRVDTSWLAVGHVDEIMSFVPAAKSSSAPWQLLFARPALAVDMLRNTSQQGHGSALMHQGKSWEDGPATVSIDEVLANQALMATNQEDQAVLDDVLDKLQDELELPDDRITYVPFLEYDYEDWGSVAYQPGTVNMLVVGRHCIIPKPFGPEVGGKDIFEQDLNTKLSALDLMVHFVDDWDTYHAYMGEIHCATNVRRAPGDSPWWTKEVQR